MAVTALAFLKAAATDCFAAQAGFSPCEASAGLLAADELRAFFFPLMRTGGTTAASAVVPPSAALQAVTADQAPLTLLQLPAEVLVLVFCRLDALSLARVAATCSELYRDEPWPMTPVEEALRQRAAARGRVSPEFLPEGTTSWVAHLAWLERRRDEAWAPVADRTHSSFFVAEGRRLLSCEREGEDGPGVLGHGALDADDPVVPTPTLLPSMAGTHISSVSAGFGSKISEGFGSVSYVVCVSDIGNFYTWGNGINGCLGHGDDEDSLVPKRVLALAGHSIISASAGNGHCLAVTEKGEVFSWGWEKYGQCGHGSSGQDQLLPRRVEALAGVRARGASAGAGYSLVVTEEGALYSLGGFYVGQLGHGNKLQQDYDDDDDAPKMVEALRHVRIAAAAAGRSHSLALAEDGTVFSWGSNNEGQLGQGQVGETEALPQKVETLSGLKVCAVAVRDLTSCAVTSTGELYTWGHGDGGRLGHGDTANELVPKRVEALREVWVVAVSAGTFHTIAVTRNGGVFGWAEVDGLGLPEAAAGHHGEAAH